MFSFNVEGILRARGFAENGTVQRYVEGEVLRRCAPYIPMKSGALIASGAAEKGVVAWNAPYAARQYYCNKGAGLRGARWFERMKADQMGAILSGAANIAGGRI